MKRPEHRRVRPMWCVLAAVTLLANGCGYQFVDYERRPGLSSFAIRTFANDSFEPGIEFVVADAFRREFLRRGAMSMVRDPEAADLVVGGTVERIRTRSRSFSSVALTLEWEVTLRLSLRARLDGNDIPIDEGAMAHTERYLASADVEATRKNREEALRKLAGLLAVRAHDMIYEVYTP